MQSISIPIIYRESRLGVKIPLITINIHLAAMMLQYSLNSHEMTCRMANHSVSTLRNLRVLNSSLRAETTFEQLCSHHGSVSRPTGDTKPVCYESIFFAAVTMRLMRNSVSSTTIPFESIELIPSFEKYKSGVIVGGRIEGVMGFASIYGQCLWKDNKGLPESIFTSGFGAY